MKKSIYRRTRFSRGFSIIETILAIIIVGLGIASLMALFGSCTAVNDYGSKMSTAVFLAEQIQSMTDLVEFDQLTQLNGSKYNGIDSSGNLIENMDDYTQTLSVITVNPVDMTPIVTPTPQAILLSVSVNYANHQIAQLNWLRTN